MTEQKTNLIYKKVLECLYISVLFNLPLLPAIILSANKAAANVIFFAWLGMFTGLLIKTFFKKEND